MVHPAKEYPLPMNVLLITVEKRFFQAITDFLRRPCSLTWDITPMHLLAVHLRNQPAQDDRLGLGKFVDPFLQPTLTDGSDLINSNLGRFARTLYLNTGSPPGVKDRSQRADHNGVQVSVHIILADHDHGADFIDFRSLSRI